MSTSINRLRALGELGQSIWLDYIRRDLYTGPGLLRLIEEDGLKGMTTNPTIFEKAIAETDLYDAQIHSVAEQGLSTASIFQALAIEDVRQVADVLKSTHDSCGGADGFVSIEANPHLAHDTQGTIAEVRELWTLCARPNVMVKIPGTREGLPAIRECLALGININITLLFSIQRYREVINAYLTALESRVESGLPIDGIHSVASFFVSRVDTNTDKKLEAVLSDARPSEYERQLAGSLRGKFGIANARMAYKLFEETFNGPRFSKLRAQGAHVQRPLWASTSTKNPAFPDLYYVEALTAPNSVDTMPLETLNAYRDHGEPKIRIHDDLPEAHAIVRKLGELGIDPLRIGLELEEEGVTKFEHSYDKILAVVEQKSGKQLAHH
jgi:transaldolase